MFLYLGPFGTLRFPILGFSAVPRPNDILSFYLSGAEIAGGGICPHPCNPGRTILGPFGATESVSQLDTLRIADWTPVIRHGATVDTSDQARCHCGHQ